MLISKWLKRSHLELRDHTFIMCAGRSVYLSSFRFFIDRTVYINIYIYSNMKRVWVWHIPQAARQNPRITYHLFSSAIYYNCPAVYMYMAKQMILITYSCITNILSTFGNFKLNVCDDMVSKNGTTIKSKQIVEDK